MAAKKVYWFKRSTNDVPHRGLWQIFGQELSEKKQSKVKMVTLRTLPSTSDIFYLLSLLTHKLWNPGSRFGALHRLAHVHRLAPGCENALDHAGAGVGLDGDGDEKKSQSKSQGKLFKGKDGAHKVHLSCEELDFLDF